MLLNIRCVAHLYVRFLVQQIHFTINYYTKHLLFKWEKHASCTVFFAIWCKNICSRTVRFAIWCKNIYCRTVRQAILCGNMPSRTVRQAILCGNMPCRATHHAMFCQNMAWCVCFLVPFSHLLCFFDSLFLDLPHKEPNAQVCDATYDAMKCCSRVNKKMVQKNRLACVTGFLFTCLRAGNILALRA